MGNGREIATITRATVDYERGYAVLLVVFEGEGWGQSLMLGIDDRKDEDGVSGAGIDAVVRFIKACGADALDKCVGAIVWVTHAHSSVSVVEAVRLKGRTGTPFDVYEWREHWWPNKYPKRPK